MECRRRLGPVAPLLLVFLRCNYLKFSPQLISGCVNRKKLLLSSLCKKETDCDDHTIKYPSCRRIP